MIDCNAQGGYRVAADSSSVGLKNGLKSLLQPPGRPGGQQKEKQLRIMTLNSEGMLCSGREIALLNLLTVNDVDIGIIKETEIPASSHGDFNVKGYNSYLPHQSNLLKAAKYRVVTLVGSALVTSTKIWLDLMNTAGQSVWIQLDIA
jgi:hypothetical protein